MFGFGKKLEKEIESELSEILDNELEGMIAKVSKEVRDERRLLRSEKMTDRYIESLEYRIQKLEKREEDLLDRIMALTNEDQYLARTRAKREQDWHEIQMKQTMDQPKTPMDVFHDQKAETEEEKKAKKEAEKMFILMNGGDPGASDS